jgi:hypothetical protein
VRLGFTLPERKIVWKARNSLVTMSSALAKLMRCVSWTQLEQRTAVYSLLPHWVPLDMGDALQVCPHLFLSLSFSLSLTLTLALTL